MLDDSDSNNLFLGSLFTNGWLSLILFVLGIICTVIVCDNKKDCAEKTCTIGKPQLMNHQCLCVEKAK